MRHDAHVGEWAVLPFVFERFAANTADVQTII